MATMHPARNTRIATAGLSFTALFGMVTAFTVNAQLAHAQQVQQLQLDEQAKRLAEALNDSNKFVKPRIQIVLVTPKVQPSPQKPNIWSGSASGSYTPYTATSRQPKRSSGHTATSGASNTQGNVVTSQPTQRTPVVVVQPNQQSQGSSGGSVTR